MITVLLTVIGVLLLWLYLKSKKSHQYWEERGIFYDKPLPFIGSSLKAITFQLNQFCVHEEIHKKHPKERYVGFYEFTKPVLLIRDPELVGKILIKDFNHFIDRDFGDVAETDVDAGLFFLHGDEWRALRYKMIPTFTTGKLRQMYPQMLTCAERLISIIDSQSDHVDFANVSTPFTMSLIASCVFGIDVDTAESSKFRQMGQKMFEMPFSRYLEYLVIFTFPKLANKLNFSFTPKDVGIYFAEIIKHTMKLRRTKQFVRNDFVQMLVQLQEKGSVDLPVKDSEDDYLFLDKTNTTVKNFEITERILVSQAFTFIMAGFEVVNFSILFTLLELSKQEQLQSRARKEVSKLIEKHGGLTYDVLREATFLSHCVDEALRLYPPSQSLLRMCTKRYELEEGKYIEPGTKIVIALHGLQKDPEHWVNPLQFDPNRWERDVVTPNSYAPFGDGPRMCIGMRFAMTEIKLGLAIILRNYNVKLSPKTKLPLKMMVNSLITKPKQKVFFNFDKIK